MIPRSIFYRIMNEKASHLLEKCVVDENTTDENIKTSFYPTPIIRYLTNPRQTFRIDTKKAQANQDAFYDIIAELEDAVNTHYFQTNSIIVHRDDKIPNIKSLDLAPNDIENRLEKSDMHFDAIRDLKLVDQFLVAFIASDPVATFAPNQDITYQNSKKVSDSEMSLQHILKPATVLLSDISLQKIEKAKQKLLASKPKNDLIDFNVHELPDL